MAVRIFNGLEFKADLYSRITSNGEFELLLCDTTFGDQEHQLWQYDDSSFALDNYAGGVVKPTLIATVDPGRWLRRYRYFLPVNADWNAGSGLAQIINKPTLATVAISGAYADLTGLPTIPSPQKAYQGITLRSGVFPILKSGTVASGVIAFHLTSDGTSTGTALFPNGIIEESVNLFVNDAAASYQMSYALTNSNKTLTVTANKLTTANILSGILGQTAANGAIVRLQVLGY